MGLKANAHTLTSRGGTKRKLRFEPTTDPSVISVTIKGDDKIDGTTTGLYVHIRKADLIRIANTYI